MAEEEKDPSQQSQEVNEVAEEAKKSLTDKKQTKADRKKKKDDQLKDMTSYQEQALQGVTKTKGNKKVLIIVFLLLGLAAVGAGIAAFFILKPQEEPEKAVVCKVEVLSYAIKTTLTPEKYIVFGSGDEFNFNEETVKTSHYTKDLEAVVTESYDVAFVYLVNNVTENRYVYTMDFSDMIIENCDVVVNVNNGQQFVINNERKIITITENGDVTLEVRFSVKDLEIPDLEENTRCEGGISLTLSLA